MSGAPARRFSPVWKIARSLPERICARLLLSKIMATWPLMTSTMPGAPPLYGTAVIVVPVALRKSCIARSDGLPGPAVAYVISPGLALASAIRSCIDLIGDDGRTYNTIGVRATRITGVKSLIGSYGRLL